MQTYQKPAMTNTQILPSKGKTGPECDFPQRSVNHIAESKIVVRSDFCSGNLARAVRGNQKNHIDLWVEQDAAPYIQGDFYKTWFYFAVTGVPQGEQITFTFRNLNNQVSERHF